MKTRMTFGLIALCILLAFPLSSFARTGGPDAYGYYFIDSSEPGGPTYSMIDISATGTLGVRCDDCNTGLVSMGFTFPFYQWDYSHVDMGSNGAISFDSGYITLGNQYLPAGSSYPRSLIAVVWDDINVTFGDSGLYYQYFSNSPHPDFSGPCFVVQWKNARHYYNYGTFDFQVILFADGGILMQFGPGNPELGSGSTTGIQNYDGSIGLQYANNSNGSLSGNLAVYFSRDPFFIPRDLEEADPELAYLTLLDIVHEDYYEDIYSKESYVDIKEESDKFLGIDCFITAAAPGAFSAAPIFAMILGLGIALFRRRSE